MSSDLPSFFPGLVEMSTHIFAPTERIRLRRLLESPLPAVGLKPGQTKTNHTSGHLPIERETTSEQLTILETLDKELKRIIKLPHKMIFIVPFFKTY